MPHARRPVTIAIRLFAAIVIVAGSLSSAALASGPGPSVQEWQTYRSTPGRFSVLMPCSPTTETKSTDTDLGPISMQMASCVTSNRFTSVIYYDVPSTVTKTAESLLADTADAFMKGGGFVEKAGRQQITIDGHPGIEIIGESADGQSIVQARYYLVRSRVYLVMVGTAASEVAAPDIGNYFGSFKVN